MIFPIIIAFLSLIGLVIAHELGHFVFAKKFGVKVEEFGIGYPPRIFGKKIGETIYSLNLLPFGAFVKIEGEEETSLESLSSFSQKPLWQRTLIILGGVISFWVIAIILLSLVFKLGTFVAVSDEEKVENAKIQITLIFPDSPAEKAGLKEGDIIYRISYPGAEIYPKTIKEIQEATKRFAGQEIEFTFQREEEVFSKKLLLRENPPRGQGAMGIGLARITFKKVSWFEAPIEGVKSCFLLTKNIFLNLFKLIGDLFLGKGLPKEAEIVGPIGIGVFLTEAFKVGLVNYLNFISVIAIYLAIFNLFPIPALDGGKLVFLGIEAIRRKPVSPKTEKIITNLFFLLLLTLMIWVTIKDIIKLFNF